MKDQNYLTRGHQYSLVGELRVKKLFSICTETDDPNSNKFCLLRDCASNKELTHTCIVYVCVVLHSLSKEI